MIEQTAVFYPHKIRTDFDKLCACYSLLEQIRLEHNRLGAITRSDWAKYSPKWRAYTLDYRSKVKPLLHERNLLKEKIRKANYTNAEWRRLSIDESLGISKQLYGDKSALSQLTTKATSPLIGKLKAVSLGFLAEEKGLDPTEDLTGYTEEDPNNRIDIGLDVAPHNMVANNDPAPYVASASSEFSVNFEAHKAFDGGLGANSYWIATATTGWLKIDMGEGNSYTIESYALQNNTIPEPLRMPKNWTLQGSNNDSDWDTLDTVVGETAWGNGEKRTYDCDVSTTAYRYFKLDVTLNNGDASYLIVGEMFLFKELAAGVTLSQLSKNEDAYLYDDKGENHFDGDFEHLFECLMSDEDDGEAAVWALANAIDDLRDTGIVNDLPTLWLGLHGALTSLYIHESEGGSLYSDGESISLDTHYWITMERDEAVGDFGTLYAYVYDDSERTSQIAGSPLSLTLHEKTDYQYFFACCTYNASDAAWVSGWGQNYDLQEVVAAVGWGIVV